MGRDTREWSMVKVDMSLMSDCVLEGMGSKVSAAFIIAAPIRTIFIELHEYRIA